MAGVSLVAETPSPRARIELLNEDPAPVVVNHGASEAPLGITSEIVAVIEAAVAAFVGKKVRILSIRMVEENAGDSNAWASQGRDMIQSSHNLVQRGH